MLYLTKKKIGATMTKLWAKLMQKDKIQKHIVYIIEEKFSYGHMTDYLYSICEQLDIASPILIKNHIFHLAKFNFVKFTQRDFMDTIDFDALILEFLPEK